MVWISGFDGLLLLVALMQLVNSIRHGSRLPLNILVTGIFIVGLATITIVTMSQLSSADWTATYTISLPSVSFLRFGN